MARIRSVKPTFWADERISELSIPARFLTIGLISSADDQGRFLASYSAVSGYVFPHDDISPSKIKKWLAEIESAGIVSLYTVKRREYGCFPNWTKHQRINRPSESILPAPSTNGQHSVNDSVNDSVI